MNLGHSRRALLTLAPVFAACTSPYLKTGETYLARGLLPIAIEVLDQGSVAEPGNAEIRDALILAEQTHQYQLRQEVSRLNDSGQGSRALERLVLLEESARRATEAKRPTEDPAAIEAERNKLTKTTIDTLQRSLDERVGRGLDVKADLVACRQLLAMVEDDPALARLCDRLRARFKLVVAVSADGDAARLLAPITAEVTRRHPELFEIVPLEAKRHNAVLRLSLQAAVVDEQDFLMTGRQAFHTFVPKTGKGGGQLEEEVTVPPTDDEINAAKRKGQPPPGPKKVKKKVWEEVKGEVQDFTARRAVSVPYQVVIESLVSDTIAVELAGAHAASDVSRYHEYFGDPRAKSTHGRDTPNGRRNARPLAARVTLQDRVQSELPQLIVNAILERVE
ncbi:MAG: hypothetical protein HY903_07500 [Deltaproteobacteria bacterium]|nr:hypothetical protein [Deltaproteobacteria bacterium]